MAIVCFPIVSALLAVPTTHVFLSCDPFWPVLPPYVFLVRDPFLHALPPSLYSPDPRAPLNGYHPRVYLRLSIQRAPLLSIHSRALLRDFHTASSAPVYPLASILARSHQQRRYGHMGCGAGHIPGGGSQGWPSEEPGGDAPWKAGDDGIHHIVLGAH